MCQMLANCALIHFVCVRAIHWSLMNLFVIWFYLMFIFALAVKITVATAREHIFEFRSSVCVLNRIKSINLWQINENLKSIFLLLLLQKMHLKLTTSIKKIRSWFSCDNRARVRTLRTHVNSIVEKSLI